MNTNTSDRLGLAAAAPADDRDSQLTRVEDELGTDGDDAKRALADEDADALDDDDDEDDEASVLDIETDPSKD